MNKRQDFGGWYGADHTARGLQQTQTIQATLYTQTATHGLFYTPTHSAQDLQFSHVNDAAYSTLVKGTLLWRDSRYQHCMQQHGAAQSVIQAYRDLGDQFLQQLGGHFSLALIDAEQKRSLLAIDKLGVGSWYYAATAAGLCFGHRATSTLAIAGLRAEINQQAVYDYLYFHAVPSPESIYQGLQKLQPGEYLWCDQQGVHTQIYWQPQFKEHTTVSLADSEAQLQRILATAIEDHAQQPHTGAFLSGGIDSSTVSGFFAKANPEQRVNTYSIGFDAEGYNELAFARSSAKHFNTQLHEYMVTPEDVYQLAPQIAAYYDEPFGNSSAVPVYYCAKMAAADQQQHLLAGDGGDELFAGNERYAKQKIFALYDNLPTALKQQLIEPLLNLDTALHRHFPLNKLKSYANQAKLGMPARLQSYNYLRRIATDKLFSTEFSKQFDLQHPEQLASECYWQPKQASMLNRMLYLDWKQTLADNDLRKVNGMCELAGIAVHYPLLDERLLEFSLSIPSAWKLRGTQLRYFFKHGLRNFLPSTTLKKSKHGFGLPFGLWMRHYRPLQDLAYDSLRQLNSRGYFADGYIETLIKQHRDEHAAYYGEFIWVLMMLELWLQTHQLT